MLDQPSHLPGVALRLHRVSSGLAWAAVVVGSAVLLGYLIGEPRLVQLAPSFPPMYPNAAIAMICGGVAVLGQAEGRIGRLAAYGATAVVGAVGVIGLWLAAVDAPRTWFESLFPTDGPIVATTPVPGRPVAETCASYTLLGLALLSLVSRRAPRLGQVLAAGAFAVGASAVVGYVLGVDRRELGGTVVTVGMALHTGLGLAVLGLAVILARPGVGFVAQLLDAGASGSVGRRLAALVALAPVVLAIIGVLLSLIAPSPEFAQSVFSVIQMGALGALVLIPAAGIARVDQQVRRSRQATRRTDEAVGETEILIAAVVGELSVAAPHLPGWDVGVRHEPAVGHFAGDSVQFLAGHEPDSPTLVAVIDIAGHGALPAMVAHGVRAHLAALWERSTPLAEVAASVNAKIVRRGTIATGVLLSIDDAGSSIDLVNAGHCPPLQIRGSQLETWTRTGPLFGLVGGSHEVRHLIVERNDLVVISTDGLQEARSPAGEEFGEDRISEIVQVRRNEPPQVIADALLDAVLAHTRGPMRDDTFILVLRRGR